MSTSRVALQQNTALPDTQPVVLSVAFPYARIGQCAVGGAEVILSHIEAALPSLGFRSVVVAHAESRPHGRLYPTPVPQGEITDAVRVRVEQAQQANIDRALAENPVALVHMHGLDFHRFRLPEHLPVLVTLHLPPSWYPDSIWNLPSNFHFICVSETERQACPPAFRQRVTVIENGVPLPDASTLRSEGRYALVLSRICAEKNIHAALDGARLAGMPAILAGEVFPYPEHQRYFAEQIQPRVSSSGQSHESRAPHHTDQPEARFLGPVTGPAKARLLARAACVLLPSLAPETSSLAAMEALAAGVPVIAVASGAVPEIVEPGRTGFLIDPAADIPAAIAQNIGRLPEIDRQACRRAAEQRFTLHRMLDAYCRLYQAHTRDGPDGRCACTPAAAPPQPEFPGEVSIQHLTDSAALYTFQSEWAALWQKDSRATPFQHPAWLLPWWRQFGVEGHLHTFVARGPNGAPLALLPLYVYPHPHSGERQLLLLGVSTSDYLDGLFDPRADGPQLAAAALQSALAQQSWDTVTLTQLRVDSPLLAAANIPPFAGLLSQAEAEPCSIISTARSLPSKLRANIRRYRHRADSTGSLSLSVAATAADALASFEELAELHHARWQFHGEPGVLADERVLAHHREAIPQLLEAGLLRLFRLTLNEDVLGLLYALADPPQRPDRALYLYLTGINTHFAELSPGTLLLHAVWEHAAAEGFARLDLLRGAESYKQLWGAERQPTFAIRALKSEQ